MQKGKATTSPPAMVLQGRPPQQNPRGPPNSQQRPEDFNPRQNQAYQIAGPLPQNLMMQAMPGQMQGPHAQGQPRLPNQTYYQRPMRIPRPPPPSNQQVYSSPPGAPMVQMIGHPGAQFLATGQPAPFIPQHVDFQLPMGGPPHYRPPQAMQGQFPPVSGPSQPHGPFVYQQSPGYPIGQPSPPVYIVRAPANPLQGMQQFQPQFEPRTRERKIIQIKDPNSNKDVTQEILKRQPASSLASTAVGTPNNTPDLSGQSSSSSTPPLTSQQQAEANVRAQFAAQVAATLSNNSEDRPKKQEYTIQKSTVNNRGDVDIVKAKETLEVQKEETLKGTRKNDTVSNVVEKVQETQMKEGTVPVKSQPKEAVKSSKLCEGSSGESLLGSKSLVSSVDATTVANGKISNVSCRVEIFTKEVLYKESQKSSAPFVSDVVKTDEKVKPSDECDKGEKVKPSDECDKDEKVKPSDEFDKDEKVQLLDECEKDEKVKVVDECEEDEKVKRLDEGEKEVATDALPVSESNILNGPMEESQEQAKEDTEEVITIDSQPEVEAAVPGTASETLEPNKVSEDNGKELTQPEETFAQTEESEVLLPSSEPQGGSGNEKVNGHEVDSKKSAVANTPVDSHGSVPPRDMKKKKQKHRIREMEKRSSQKETDMMEAYTEKPVQQETPDEGEEQPAEETTETQQEVQVTEDAQSDDDTWETKEEMEEVSDQQPDGEKQTYMYDRDFLLQFQTNPMCLQKPDGLPDLEVVLVQARAPSKPGFQQNRMPKVDGGENTFLPSYMRQGSKTNDRNMRGNRGRNVQAKKVIDFPSVQQQPDLKRVDNRWVRPSEASKSGNEEETKTEELYRKVRSILNKLTPQKFQTLTQQISELEIDTPERLEGAIDLIFEKAIDEANFSVAYANMCKCLLNKKVVVEKEGVKKDVSFRKILLNKCQKEFEREKSVEKTIHEKLEDLTKQGLSEEELQSRKKDLQDEERQQKRRTLGNIRFIGELFKLKMLTESIMHDCVVKLLKSNDEESFECLCKLLVTIGKDLDHQKAKPRVDQYFAQIKKIISARITSSRVRFMMQDIVDLRSNSWVPRREDNNPKTIDQIHREAADQAKKTQIAIQIARQDKRLQQRGNTGGRDSPRPGAIPQADESWTTVGRGPRNVSVDPTKFQNIKRSVDSENISLGPGGRGYGAWARGSSGGSGAVGAGSGPSAAASAGSSIAGVSAETDNRPANRYSALAGDRKLSAPARASSSDSRRQEPRSPVSGGGRRGPLPQDEREKAVEAVRAAMQPKRVSQDRESGRESPRTTAEVAPATDSGDVAGSAALAASQEVTEEMMKKKTLSIIDEFLNIRDNKEVAECLKELQSPSRHHVFVEVTFNHTMEKRASERQATGKLIHFLMRDGVLTAQHYLNGLESIFAVAEDTEIDIPQLWKYLGELMGPTAFDGNLGLDELFKCVFKYVSKHKAARLFACILQSSEKSPQDVRAFLDTSKVTVYTFFDDADEAREFAKDKNIEYALGPSPPSQITGSTSAHSADVEEELRTVILKRKARNEEVMDWIDKNVFPSSTKESPFIRALVTVVCEGALYEDDEGSWKCNVDELKERKNLLQKYIDANTSLEVQALYAVQALFVKKGHPPGFVKSYFDSLYDEDIISEESFHTWENSLDEEPGKGVTVMAASEFFRWLKSALEENGEGS